MLQYRCEALNRWPSHSKVNAAQMNKKKHNSLCCFNVLFFTFLTVTLLCGSGDDGCENLTQMQSLCHPVYVPTGLFMSEPLPPNLLRVSSQILSELALFQCDLLVFYFSLFSTATNRFTAKAEYWQRCSDSWLPLGWIVVTRSSWYCTACSWISNNNNI